MQPKLKWRALGFMPRVPGSNPGGCSIEKQMVLDVASSPTLDTPLFHGLHCNLNDAVGRGNDTIRIHLACTPMTEPLQRPEENTL
eukprot:7984523-Pyramimonas_sp.AAC.1